MNWETVFLILFSPLIILESAIAMIIGIMLIVEMIDDWKNNRR
jgi:hypothetical protein